MKYFDMLEKNKEKIINHLESLFTFYKVEPVGYGYIDCIIMKNNLGKFIESVSDLGILITDVGWWCYVDPNEPSNCGCPHGMGGPQSEYYKGWFSELQNDYYSLDGSVVDNILQSYDKQLIHSLNLKTFEGINKILEIPFKYTPNDYINENKCVQPSLWLLVPDDWRRK